jgi:hypothetical protein
LEEMTANARKHYSTSSDRLRASTEEKGPRAWKLHGGDSTRCSTHSNRISNGSMKTLDGLRPQRLT